MKRHRFSVIEGVDGVGKSTCLRLVRPLVEGLSVLKTPADNMAAARKEFDVPGVDISSRFFFYFATTIYASDLILKRALEAPLLCDRYILSTIAHHNVLSNGRFDFTSYLDVFGFFGGARPDLTILLTADAVARAERIKKRDPDQNNFRDYAIDIASRVQEEFLRLALLPAYGANVEIINTSDMDENAVAKKVAKLLGG